MRAMFLKLTMEWDSMTKMKFFLKNQLHCHRQGKCIMRAVLAQPAAMEASTSRLTIGGTIRWSNRNHRSETHPTWGLQVSPRAPSYLARARALVPAPTPIDRSKKEGNSSIWEISNLKMISLQHLSRQSYKEFWATVQVTSLVGIIMITHTLWVRETASSVSSMLASDYPSKCQSQAIVGSTSFIWTTDWIYPICSYFYFCL